MLVGDRERERAVRELRRHYAEGRLDDGELSERVELVLRARSRWEIEWALRRLPRLGQTVARLRHALLVAVVGLVWLMLSAAIFVAFVAWIAAHGATLAGLVAFPLVWLVLSALAYHRTAVSRRRLHRL